MRKSRRPKEYRGTYICVGAAKEIYRVTGHPSFHEERWVHRYGSGIEKQWPHYKLCHISITAPKEYFKSASDEDVKKGS